MNAVQKVSYANLYLSAFIVNIVYFGAGQSMVWTSPAIPRLKETESSVSRLDSNWMLSCFAVGQTLGPIIGGCFMDSLGRKPTTFLMILFLLVSYSLLTVASSVEMLFGARIIGGFTFGMSVSVLPVYVAEISDVDTRAFVNSFPLASRSFGYFTIYAIGPVVTYLTLNLFCLIAPVVALLLFFLLPESPYHMFAKDKPKMAEKTLAWLRKGATQDQLQAEISSLKKTVEEMKANKRGFSDLLSSRANIRALYISSGLLFFLQMSGVPVFMSITEDLFNLARISLSTHICTLVFGAVTLAVGLVGPSLTRRFGYKGPLILSALGMSLSLIVLGVHYYLISLGYDMKNFSLVPLLSLAAYISFYSLGFSNSAFSVVGELFSPSIKAVGTSLTNSIGFGFSLVSIQLFSFTKAVLGIQIGIWGFAVINALAVPFTYVFVPNTKSMSLVEIQEMLNRPWFDRKNKVDPVEKYTMNDNLA